MCFCEFSDQSNTVMTDSKMPQPHLSMNWPVFGSHDLGQTQGRQPSSPKPQYPGRHWLHFSPPTPGLQGHCPVRGWQHGPSPLCWRDTEPWGSHQHPAEEGKEKSCCCPAAISACGAVTHNYQQREPLDNGSSEQ